MVQVVTILNRRAMVAAPSLCLLPPPPQTQARSSTTFRPPPLDGSLTLSQMYDWHLEHTPNHRLFVYVREDGSVKTIYWPEAVKAIYTGAHIIGNRIQWRSYTSETPVVAILAASDTIPYFITLMSIMCNNYIAFPISPRNSATAIAYLINKVGVKHILVGREQSMLDLSKDTLDILRSQYPSSPAPALSLMLLFEDLFLQTEATVPVKKFPHEYQGSDAIVMILHSSGSTAHPKPIFWTNHRFAQLSLIPWFGERDLTDKVFSLHTVPMYHGMGVFQLCWTASCGLVVSAFEPKSPTPMATPDGLFRAAKATDSDIIFSVPSFIEAWSRSPEYVKWLATRGGVLFGGGPLNQEVGDSLTAAGVSIFNLYGSTEGGIMSTMLPAEVGHDWNYFRFPALVTPEMIPNDDNTFELVMVANEFCRPSVLNTKVGGIDAYSTSDLFKPHPTKSGYWKVYGRTDDQIMHSTGEKTNPGPLENILNQNPFVLSSVIFGRGRFQAGAIVDPKPDYRFDPTDELKLAEFRNKIWPTVERMNEYAPQHSRLFKEMILVSKLSKPFTYTAKSTARRQVIISDYEEDISALYDTVEESAQTAITPPPRWDTTSTVRFIRQIVIAVMSMDVSDDDDIFQRGCDSLQATWIRNSLLRAIRDTTQFNTRKVAGNFVYNYPTIATLTTFIANLLSGNNGGGDISHARIVDEMRTMVSKYSQNFLDHYHKDHEASHSAERSGRHTVLLTGSTGALGCYLLVRLVSHLDVSRVYALNRKSPYGKTLIQRQEEALIEGGFESETLHSKKIILCEADLATDCFGLPHATYQEMQGSVTHIIHNAWSVDFNLTLKTFESNIKGLRNLIDFSLSSTLTRPARVLYTSSIGVFQNTHGNSILAEKPIEPEVAIGTGYAESKWVCEKILCTAAEHTSIEVLIVRVGQLSGGLNGAWNVNEWVPALIQSASVLGLLPDDHKPVSWIPLDIAASSLVDFCMSLKLPPDHIVHLIHPHPVSWSSLASILSSEYSVPLVPYAEWLAALEQKAAIQSENVYKKPVPAEAGLTTHLRVLRLLPFFRRIAAKETSSEAMGFDSLDIAEAVALSPTLADHMLPQLGSEDVKGWLAHWRKKGLLPTSFP